MTNAESFDTGTMETARDRVAEGLETSADAVRKAARSFPLPERVARALGKAAGRLNQSAMYVEDHTTSEMAEDARAVVRRNPGPSLLVAAAVGLAIGWTFRD